MINTPKALVIDDEQQICRFIDDVLSAENWTVSKANSAEQAFELLLQEDWQLIFCDVMLGEINGYEVLRRFAESGSTAKFILMTGQGSAAGALDATAFGAHDYLLKPFSVNDVQTIAATVSAQQYINPEVEELNTSIGPRSYVSDIPLIGKSPKFVECLKLVGRVAATNLPVLITGESGTGKEVVAQAIHQRSHRVGRPFVAVNCGAIPVELIESELFGHMRGAFTGAQQERRGLWEEAEGGTIFLDEITETNPLFQVKLLRALQQGEIRRVGSNKTIKTDIRVLAATNRNIETEVQAERFRQDLMYRLNVMTIYLPPLRERREDIPLLVEHFAGRYAAEYGAPSAYFPPEMMRLLQNYRWPGNVRELENAVLHAASLCDQTVYPEHLPERVRNAGSEISVSAVSLDKDTPDTVLKRENSAVEWLPLAKMEAEYAERVLSYTNGNKQAASRILDIDRKTLIRILSRSKPENENHD